MGRWEWWRAGVCPRTLTGPLGEVRTCTLQQRQHGGVQEGTLLALLVPWVQPAREGSERESSERESSGRERAVREREQ